MTCFAVLLSQVHQHWKGLSTFKYKRGYSLKAFLDEMTLEVNIDLKMLAMCSIVSKGVDT